MKQSTRYVLTLCIATVCALALVLLHVRVRDMRIHNSEQMRALEDAPAKDQQSRMVQKELLNIEEKLKRISTIVISQDELVGVVESISRIAQQSGVQVQVPEVQTNPTASGVVEDIRIRMNAVGSPAALVAFLYRLEHLPYLIRIASWNLDATHISQMQSFVGIAPADKSASKTKSGSSLAVETIISIIKQ